MSTDTQTLAERITSVLVANGFTQYDPAGSYPAYKPSFVVTPGIGATVGISWLDAPTDERALLLTKYENRLRANGLVTDNHGHYLYVCEPGESEG